MSRKRQMPTSTPAAKPDASPNSSAALNTASAAPTLPDPPSQPAVQVQATSPAVTLTARQQQLLAAACREIEADPHFKALGNATFNCAEVTPGLDETERGYLYLRYDVPGGTPQEFWAHVSGYASVKWRTGEVSVPLD